MHLGHNEHQTFFDPNPDPDFELDNYSELAPDDSVSQVGLQAVAPSAPITRTPSYGNNPSRGLAPHLVNAIEPPTAPPSPILPSRSVRHSGFPHAAPFSFRSSRVLSSSNLVSANRDRVRYSWQSTHADQPDRPRIHIIKIVSDAAAASAGLPGGEALGFSVSPKGRRIACYNSARLFILQTASLPVNVSQEYALQRRPLAVELIDDGCIVAVLSDAYTVNAYDLSNNSVRLLKTIKLDYSAVDIALSRHGTLLATAHENGVQVFSLHPNSLSNDKRGASCAAIDRLHFSDDDSALIGTTTRPNAASTVIISVPLFATAEDDILTPDEVKEAWCGNMLDPVNVIDASHAIFFRQHGNVSNEKLLSWNAAHDTFGLLDVLTLEYNHAEFPIRTIPPLSACGGLGAMTQSLPTLDERGDAVAMIVNDRTIRLYTVPGSSDGNVVVEAHSADHELDKDFGCPFTDVHWVHSRAGLPLPREDTASAQGRLLVASPGTVKNHGANDAMIHDFEGGRIIVFDFDRQYAGMPIETSTFRMGAAPPQILEEGKLDEAQEVAQVRRRTINASKIHYSTPVLSRVRSTVHRHGSRRQDIAGTDRNAHPDVSPSWEVLPGLAEADGVLIEEPYDGNHPRSRASLMRAATAATSHRRQAWEDRRAQLTALRTGDVAPLPEYTKEANSPLPGRYRELAGLGEINMPGQCQSAPPPIQRAQTDWPRPRQEPLQPAPITHSRSTRPPRALRRARTQPFEGNHLHEVTISGPLTRSAPLGTSRAASAPPYTSRTGWVRRRLGLTSSGRTKSMGDGMAVTSADAGRRCVVM